MGWTEGVVLTELETLNRSRTAATMPCASRYITPLRAGLSLSDFVETARNAEECAQYNFTEHATAYDVFSSAIDLRARSRRRAAPSRLPYPCSPPVRERSVPLPLFAALTRTSSGMTAASFRRE